MDERSWAFDDDDFGADFAEHNPPPQPTKQELREADQLMRIQCTKFPKVVRLKGPDGIVDVAQSLVAEYLNQGFEPSDVANHTPTAKKDS